ncbi:SKP1-like protein 11 [Gossypium hirsutum]|uniref:SKP1-like protein n=1 Tax=Gossypium hirsutum TaxID=3635 RepID=A0ABM3ASW7_GOSHI|nr:SKP1-like protein 11 [Gossypium hirsutum]
MLSSKNSALESKDNEIFEVEESIAIQSELIKTMATMVNSKAYVNEPNYHVEQNNKIVDEELSDWESKFFEVDMDDLHELFMAANYLEIESLLNGVAKRVADIIKACMNVEVIRQTFGINNDFAAQQEEEIRKLNSWNHI